MIPARSMDLGGPFNPQLGFGGFGALEESGAGLDPLLQALLPFLARGRVGDDVAAMQAALNQAGIQPPIPVDGIFGPSTERAVRDFQRQSGLPVTGSMDRGTSTALAPSYNAAARSELARVAPRVGDATPDGAVSVRSLNTPRLDKARIGQPVSSVESTRIGSDFKAGPGVKGLLDSIAHAEGTSDAKAQAKGFKSGYDTTLGYGAYTKAGLNGNKPITEMTLGEVKQVQREMLAHPKNNLNSSAVGKYQIVGTTLRGLQKEMGLPDSAKFTPALQDKMGAKLLERRGLTDLQNGKITSQKFQNNIAKEWASIPTTQTGKSAYGQHTGISSQAIQSAINGAKADTAVAKTTTDPNREGTTTASADGTTGSAKSKTEASASGSKGKDSGSKGGSTGGKSGGGGGSKGNAGKA